MSKVSKKVGLAIRIGLATAVGAIGITAISISQPAHAMHPYDGGSYHTTTTKIIKRSPTTLRRPPTTMRHTTTTKVLGRR